MAIGRSAVARHAVMRGSAALTPIVSVTVGLVIDVPIEQRTGYVLGEDRTFEIAAEQRTFYPSRKQHL